ncbi:MAG: hypothetical protein ACI4A3_05650 [Lachnospiraceae bacterium]
MKKIRISKWCYVEQDKNVLLIDSRGIQISSNLFNAIKEKLQSCTIVSTIEKWMEDNPDELMEQYDYIFIFADNSLRNSKGLFEWSRFIRKYVETPDSDTEYIIKMMRDLERGKCICLKKAGDRFKWKIDKVI